MAWIAPSWGAPHSCLYPEVTVHVAVALSFFMSGLTLPSETLVRALKHLRLHAFIQIFNFGVMPIVALGWWSAAEVCGAPAVLGAGLIALACMPTTIASAALLTRAATGNEAAAIVNATLGNVLGIVITPVLMMILLRAHGTIELGPVLSQLGQDVLAPLIIGMLARACLKSYWQISAGLGQIPSWCVVFIVYTIFCRAFSDHSTVIAGSFVAWTMGTVLLVHASSLALCWGISAWKGWGFSRADRIAALYCGTQKTMALGAPMLAIIWNDNPQLAALTLPLVIYHVLQIAIGGVIASRLTNHRSDA